VELRRQGGIFSVAHPFVIGDPLCSGCEWEYFNLDPAQIDTLEIWSGSWHQGAIFNWRAIAWWNQLLNEGHRITGVVARDVHRLSQFNQDDTANTYVRAYNCTQTEILNSLRRGEVQISTGPLLTVKLLADDQEYTIGDTVSFLDQKNALLQISCDALPEACLLQVIADGQKVYEGQTGTQTSWEVKLNEVHRWCRIQVHQADPFRAPVVLTNCIYFSSD
jgi:hypothetical protein